MIVRAPQGVPTVRYSEDYCECHQSTQPHSTRTLTSCSRNPLSSSTPTYPQCPSSLLSSRCLFTLYCFSPKCPLSSAEICEISSPHPSCPFRGHVVEKAFGRKCKYSTGFPTPPANVANRGLPRANLFELCRHGNSFFLIISELCRVWAIPHNFAACGTFGRALIQLSARPHLLHLSASMSARN